jgi:hypothetical protein
MSAGEIHAIIAVFELPPKESRNKYVRTYNVSTKGGIVEGYWIGGRVHYHDKE